MSEYSYRSVILLHKVGVVEKGLRVFAAIDLDYEARIIGANNAGREQYNYRSRVCILYVTGNEPICLWEEYRVKAILIACGANNRSRWISFLIEVMLARRSRPIRWIYSDAVFKLFRARNIRVSVEVIRLHVIWQIELDYRSGTRDYFTVN